MDRSKFVDFCIIFLAFGLLFLVLREFQNFLRPFVIALILTFLFAPLTRLPLAQKRIVWGISVGIVAFIFGGIFYTLSILEVESSQVESVEQESSLRDNVKGALSKQFTFGDFSFDLKSVLNPGKIAEAVGEIVSSFLSIFGSFFGELFLVFLFLLFLLPGHDASINKFAKTLSKDKRDKFLTGLHEIEKNIRAYLLIKSTASTVTALASLIIMFFFGAKYAILLAFLIFALNFIPSIGSIIAVLIALGVYLITEPLSGVFFMYALLLIMVQLIVGNILEPRFAGKQLEIPPVVILLSLFFWGAVWGIPGMFFAVPLTSIIKIVAEKIGIGRKLFDL